MTLKYLPFEIHGETLVVIPSADYRKAAEDALRQELQTLGARADDVAIKNIVVDLAALPYFGSAALEWMVTLWKKIRDRRGKFVLCSVSEGGLQILVATRFHSQWPVAADRTAAWQLIGAAHGGFAPSA